MIYDKLLVALLSMLSSEPSGSTNALIAQYPDKQALVFTTRAQAEEWLTKVERTCP